MDNLVKDRVAIIPARGGSKRLPKKNIMDFFGKPMIAWTIKAALETELFDTVLVSTDSREIAEVAVSYGASVPFLRNKKADDHSTVSEATLTGLVQLEDFNEKKYKTVVQLMANCPMRTSKNIIDQVKSFEKNNLQKSILSGFQYGMFNPWWAHIKDNEGNYRKLMNNFDDDSRSQDLKDLVCPTGATWISTSENLKKYGTFYSPNYSFFEITWQEAVDIDDYEDFKLAKAAYILRNEKI
ncbi:acylneuraminate cytidylyltransferase family protein [Psychroflexus aestuariivivens]|uniref:acylneuraminate cytidylyltransferase family protein n=1 Tax=Psychroflexus aestuariivivens TaxID=1795040 RepID=UPI000FD6F1F3|nr:acylneuraminate cytidylyltransferase family protein [Psychroflexus aestuariivivens]